jgi:hypothetical protein
MSFYVFGIVEGVLVLVLTGGVTPYVFGLEFLFLFLFVLVGSRPTRLVSYGMSSRYYIPGQFAICYRNRSLVPYGVSS